MTERLTPTELHDGEPSTEDIIDTAISFIDADDGCPFCGCDPYHYVDVGLGGRGVPVAVVCCDHGIGLFQHNDEGLTRAAGRISEARYIIGRLLAVLETPTGRALLLSLKDNANG